MGDSRRTATHGHASFVLRCPFCSKLRDRGVNKETGGVICSQPCGTRGDPDFAHTGPRLYRGGGGGVTLRPCENRPIREGAGLCSRCCKVTEVANFLQILSEVASYLSPR